MNYLLKVVQNRNFVLILAIVLGLLLGENITRFTQPLVLPLLALAMTLSAMNIKSGDSLSLKTTSQTILYSLLLNYLVLGGFLLLMAHWLIGDNEIWIGFVLLASMPPAVAVVPFSHALSGNTRFALIGMIGCYVAAIAIIPLSMLIFLGIDYFDPLRLLIILGELVLIPILVSRILLFVGVARYIDPWQGTILNWSFFFVIFTLIGLNRQAFFGESDTILKICAIAFVTTFILGYLIGLLCKTLGIKRGTTISVILMGTLKNYALAGGILLSLFGERPAIPPSVCVMFGVLLVAWIGFRFRGQSS